VRAWHVAVLLGVPLAMVLTTGWIATSSAYGTAHRAAEADSHPTAPAVAKEFAVAAFRTRPFPFVRSRLRNRYAPTNFEGYRAHPKNRHGVPERIYRGDRYYAPSGVAWAGLEMLGKYLRTGDRKSLAIARACADELRDLINQAGGSGWLPWPVPNGGNHLQAPWYNALSQGLALALFSRFYQLEHHPADQADADLVFTTFERIGPGPFPWVSQVTRNGHIWFEHFAGGYHEHVLNAHLWATFGLYDYWLIAPSPTSLRFLEGGVTTMRDQAHKFRRPGTFAWYCLVHKVAHAKYQGFVVRELQSLGRTARTPYFSRLAGLLHRDYP
jgi:D-glucuronyl C5-epimerase C-terminus